MRKAYICPAEDLEVGDLVQIRGVWRPIVHIEEYLGCSSSKMVHYAIYRCGRLASILEVGCYISNEGELHTIDNIVEWNKELGIKEIHISELFSGRDFARRIPKEEASQYRDYKRLVPCTIKIRGKEEKEVGYHPRAAVVVNWYKGHNPSVEWAYTVEAGNLIVLAVPGEVVIWAVGQDCSSDTAGWGIAQQDGSVKPVTEVEAYRHYCDTKENEGK